MELPTKLYVGESDADHRIFIMDSNGDKDRQVAEVCHWKDAVKPEPKDETFAAEIVRRWNAHNELRDALKAIVDELEEYGFIGEQGSAKEDENHYTGSPSYQKAKALIAKATQP